MGSYYYDDVFKSSSNVTENIKNYYSNVLQYADVIMTFLYAIITGSC